MAEERKGFLTPEQEVKLDELIKLKGIAEGFDGKAIKLADNLLLEKVKGQIPAEALDIIYMVIDELFDVLTEPTVEQ